MWRKKGHGWGYFSKTGPQNRPLEYKEEPKFHPRPTMPKFVETPKEYHESQAKTIATWKEKFSIYQSLSEECRRALPFRYFCETQFRGKPRGAARNPYQNYELKNAIGKITLPYFDGTSNCSVSLGFWKWIHIFSWILWQKGIPSSWKPYILMGRPLTSGFMAWKH